MTNNSVTKAVVRCANGVNVKITFTQKIYVLTLCASLYAHAFYLSPQYMLCKCLRKKDGRKEGSWRNILKCDTQNFSIKSTKF